MALTLISRSGATMRQTTAPLPKNERGFAICRTPSGQLIRGPEVEGTPLRVTIPLVCPTGSAFVGLHHTHPKGTAWPSQLDINSAKDFTVPLMCITDETKTRCFKITGRTTGRRQAA